MPEQPPSPLESPRAVPPHAGGETACWLASVCPVCGAFTEGPGPCWNCGRPAGPDLPSPADR